MQIEDNHRCFACGMNNPDGLRIEWKVEGLVMTAEYLAEAKYQGWKGILHGGIISTLLDEAMTRLSWIVCGGALTAEMTVRFIAPAKIGQLLFVRGEILNESRKIVEMKASITTEDGLIARSTGKAIKTKVHT